MNRLDFLTHNYGDFQDIVEYLEDDDSYFRPFDSHEVTTISNDDVIHYIEFKAKFPNTGCFVVIGIEQSKPNGFTMGVNNSTLAYCDSIKIYKELHKIECYTNSKLVYESDKNHSDRLNMREFYHFVQFHHLKPLKK